MLQILLFERLCPTVYSSDSQTVVCVPLMFHKGLQCSARWYTTISARLSWLPFCFTSQKIYIYSCFFSVISQ